MNGIFHHEQFKLMAFSIILVSSQTAWSTTSEEDTIETSHNEFIDWMEFSVMSCSNEWNFPLFLYHNRQPVKKTPSKPVFTSSTMNGIFHHAQLNYMEFSNFICIITGGVVDNQWKRLLQNQSSLKCHHPRERKHLPHLGMK